MADSPLNNPDPDNEGDGTAPRDGTYVPRERFNEVTAERNRLRRELEAKSAGDGSPGADTRQPERYTREQLQHHVDQGTISEGHRDQILERQMREDIAADVKAEVTTEVTVAQQESAHSAAIQAYVDVAPELADEASELRGRVQTEMDAITEIQGAPKTSVERLAQERIALKNALGSVSAFKRAREAAAEETRDVHLEGGGTGDPETPPGDAKPPKDITARLKGHYESMIGRGMYTGWDDPVLKRELEGANKDLMRRSAARA